MTSQPTPGEVLNGESVRLLLPGDRIQFMPTGIIGAFFRIENGYVCWQAAPATLVRLNKPAAFVFLSRPLEPSGGQDGGGVETLLIEARDLLLERIHGNPARSAGHNARLAIEAAIQALASPAKVTGWPSREAIEGAVKVAMNDAWADICSDSGCFPADIRRVGRGPLRLEYRPAVWTDLTAGMTASVLLALFPRPEDEGAA